MADKQPGAGEDALQFLGVDRLVDKDLAADLPGSEIHQPGAVTRRACRRHTCPPNNKKENASTQRTRRLRKGREGAERREAPFTCTRDREFAVLGRCAPEAPSPC